MTDPVDEPVRWSGRRSPDDAEVVIVRGEVEPGWYVYAVRPPPPPALLPGQDPMEAFSGGGPTSTWIEVDGDHPAGPIFEPEPERRFDPGFGRAVLVHQGRFELRVTTAVDRLTVGYQACNGQLCMSPRTQSVEIDGLFV